MAKRRWKGPRPNWKAQKRNRMDDPEAILKQVFGGSSSDNEEGSQTSPAAAGKSSPIWEPIKDINGLWLCNDFLSAHQQSALVTAILNEGWFVESFNDQAMRFGNLPSWAIELSDSILEAILFGECNYRSANLNGGDDGMDACLPLSSEILQREPLFDQLIANMYQPGEYVQGICAHVDLMRFEDGIAIVSLESTCVMHFSQIAEVGNDGELPKSHATKRIPILLTPGSLILMSGEARYLWKHEINRKPSYQVWEGKELDQNRRISITLRKLCRSD